MDSLWVLRFLLILWIPKRLSYLNIQINIRKVSTYSTVQCSKDVFFSFPFSLLFLRQVFTRFWSSEYKNQRFWSFDHKINSKECKQKRVRLTSEKTVLHSILYTGYCTKSTSNSTINCIQRPFFLFQLVCYFSARCPPAAGTAALPQVVQLVRYFSAKCLPACWPCCATTSGSISLPFLR